MTAAAETAEAGNGKTRKRASREKTAPRSRSSRAKTADSGRKAKPVSMSLMPDERAELDEFTALTEIGPTTLYRELVAPHVRAAIWAIRSMHESGMEIRSRHLPPTIWYPGAEREELDDAYSGAKSVGLGNA